METENNIEKKIIFNEINCILDKFGEKYLEEKNEKLKPYLYEINYFSPEERLFFSKQVYNELDEDKSSVFLWWKKDRDYKLVAYKLGSTEKILLEKFWKFRLDRVYINSKHNL